MKCRGYLTVYLALSLTALLAVMIVLFMGIKKNTVRMEEELALDTAGWSVLAEYHQELFRQYDLLFIDTSYGSSYPEIEAIGEHVRNYADKNLQNTNLIDAKTERISIQEAAAAADDGGAVLEQQIMEYMENYLGIEKLEEIMSEYQRASPEQIEEDTKLLEKRDENETRLDNEPPPVKKVTKHRHNSETGETESYEEEEEVPIENPADYVNDLRNKGVLNLVIEKPDEISQAAVSLNEYISHRADRMQCTGLLSGEAQDISFFSDLKRKALLNAYIFQKFGYYGSEKEGSCLKYQVEYLLGEEDSDVENLKAAVHKLLWIREAANAAYLYTDTQKKAEITALASTVAAVTLAPYLQPLIETSILFAWAYVESLQDVKILMDGGKVPVIKTAEDWHTGLDCILDLENGSVSGETSNGLNYGQYLGLLLCLKDKQELLFSMMDIMEMDIRKTEYNENFRMDGCVSGFRVTAEFGSRDGGNCSFDRTYHY